MSSTAGSTFRLGVDLGTTWTAAAVARAGGGAAEAVALGDAAAAMPSVVALDGESIVTGDAAERRLASEPTSGVREPKRRLGDTTPFIIGGTPYGADALMGHLLRQVVDTVTTTNGAPPVEVVLTHPANWGDYKLDLLREAARIADVSDIVLVTEPEAAAAHYVRLGRVARGQTVAVYDFGGGTFDVAIVRCADEGTEVLGDPQGLERLGGLDLDEAVLAHVNGALDGRLGELDPDDPAVRRGMAHLRVECTKAKEALSADSETTVAVGLPDVVTEIRMTRDEFEAAIRPRLADTLAALDRAMASAGVTNDDLAGVLLVGGSSRIPLVAEQVAAHTGRPILVDADAKLVVALGAAGAGGGPATDPSYVDNTRETTMADDSKSAGDKAAGEGQAASVPAKKPADKGSGAKGSDATPKGKRDKLVTPGRVAAGAAGLAAAAGVTAAGMAAAGALTDDDRDTTDETVPPVEPATSTDESMDAFDEVAGGGDGSAGFSGGGGAGGGRAAGGATRRTATPDDRGDGGPSARPAQATAAQASAPAGGPAVDPQIETVRAELRERLEAWEPPPGADPEDAAELRSELEGLLDRFHAAPGQSIDHTIATLRDQFEDKVEDFAQDVRIDALIDERRGEQAMADELSAMVADTKSTLSDRLAGWEPPEGADPAAVAELREGLAGILDSFVPVPGSTADQALAELERRFDSRVTDFAQDQKIDALVGLESSTATDAEPGFRPEVTTPKLFVAEGVRAEAAELADAVAGGDGETGFMTAPVRRVSGLVDEFDEMVAGTEVVAGADPDDGGESGIMTAQPAQPATSAVVDFEADLLGADLVSPGAERGGAFGSAIPDPDDQLAQILEPDPIAMNEEIAGTGSWQSEPLVDDRSDADPLAPVDLDDDALSDSWEPEAEAEVEPDMSDEGPDEPFLL